MRIVAVASILLALAMAIFLAVRMRAGHYSGTVYDCMDKSFAVAFPSEGNSQLPSGGCTLGDAIDALNLGYSKEGGAGGRLVVIFGLPDKSMALRSGARADIYISFLDIPGIGKQTHVLEVEVAGGRWSSPRTFLVGTFLALIGSPLLIGGLVCGCMLFRDGDRAGD